MVEPQPLSRRERQIMDVVFSQSSASVKQIQQAMEDPPTVMAVRRMVHILVEKGHLKRKKSGREVIYRPARSARKVGASALEHVIETFFGGSVDEALAAHFARKEKISEEQLTRLQEMIAAAKKNQKN